MRDVNYRNVRSSPPRISKLSDLENDLNILTSKEVEDRINKIRMVTSVNGQSGEIDLDMPIVRRSEIYTGTTNANGNFTVTYTSPFSSVPDVQPQLQSGTSSQVVRITNSTVSGFTVNVTNRASVTLLAVEVLLAATTPVVGAPVSVLVTAQ